MPTPPWILPVLDVRGGQAVHAIGGDRANYRPIQSRFGTGSDPLALGLAYWERLGLQELYLADLDAIAGNGPNVGLIDALALEGIFVWVDAGVRDGTEAIELWRAGADQIIVGSETILGAEVLGQVVEALGRDSISFSLDHRGGRPLLAEGARWPGEGLLEIVEAVIDVGVLRVILLDLARVGGGAGLGDLDWLASVSRTWPEIQFGVGGGVRGQGDVEEAGRAGAEFVLAGSALHDGRLGEPR